MSYFLEYKIEGESDILEIIMAELSMYEFDTFEESEKFLLAYIEENKDDEDNVKDICRRYNVSYSKKSIEKINWNEEWEKNFHPIVVRDICTVRADFHPKSNTPIDLIITPKMSFGTGHHSTTYLMLDFLLDENLKDKEVCDMGCGTGILGILCEKQGAKKIDAVDIDEWCITNTTENIKLNNSTKLNPLLGEKEKVENKIYDTILANINKNVLLDSIKNYSKLIKKEGILFLSGFYTEDKKDILEYAKENNFSFVEERENKNWLALKLKKV